MDMGCPLDHILPLHHHSVVTSDYSVANSLLVSDAIVPVPLGSCETHLGCSCTLTSWSWLDDETAHLDEL